MRVAVVCPYSLDEWGGVQQQASGLVEGLRRQGVDAYLVGPGAGGDGVDVGRSVPLPANASMAPVALAPAAWARTIAAVAPADVVHVHEPFVPLVGLAALHSHKPVVATFHADPSRLVRGAYHRARRVWHHLLGRAVVVAVSPVAASALRPFRDAEIVPNAIDVGAYGRGPVTSGTVLFVGRDEPRKGLDVLLEAWPRIRAAHPSARLLVVGSERVHAPAGVTYLGRVDEAEKRRALAEAEILCAPNLGGESFGLVVAEAMASGCAVVATALPGFAAVLGESAVLVPPWDVEGLADAVGALLSDGSLRAGMADAAASRVQMFDLGTVVARYRELYTEAHLRGPNR